VLVADFSRDLDSMSEESQDDASAGSTGRVKMVTDRALNLIAQELFVYF
jgi:hypothetical protein